MKMKIYCDDCGEVMTKTRSLSLPGRGILGRFRKITLDIYTDSAGHEDYDLEKLFND